VRDTIDMAREAGFKEHNGMAYVTTINDDCAKELKAFEALVRADEREACAKACDELHWIWHMGDNSGPKECANAIRARGNT
jgi:hypothetical protein